MHVDSVGGKPNLDAEHKRVSVKRQNKQRNPGTQRAGDRKKKASESVHELRLLKSLFKGLFRTVFASY